MNYTNTEKEIRALDFQMIISFIFILATLVSIIITYNESYYLKYGRRLINLKDAKTITKINRIIIIILLFAFLYISYQIREIDAAKGKNLTPDDLQILASYLSILAGLVVLYIVFKYSEDALTTTENPSI